MNKQKLFIDFDSTIIHSIKAYCDTYNLALRYHPEFKEAKWWLVEKWDLKDQCPLVKSVEDIFASEIFFDYADFINDNTKEIIEKLCDKYDVITCSIGTIRNIQLKLDWLNDNIPCIKNHIMLVKYGCTMNKETVNMQDSIFIDDVKSNLDSSNANIKICFGDTYDWNKDFNGIHCINWTDIGEMLL